MPFYDEESYRRIPYEEYKAINELMHAHLRTHNGKLRALIAFGEIVTRGGTFDIDLLEVVEGWRGQSSVTFSSSEALPLRGQLRLHLLTPEEFEESDGGMHLTEKRLLERVREGYEIVYEAPPAMHGTHSLVGRGAAPAAILWSSSFPAAQGRDDKCHHVLPPVPGRRCPCAALF